MDPSGRPGRPENIEIYKVFVVFHVAPQKSSRTSKSTLGRSQNDPQEAPRSGPRRPRRGSGAFKTAPRAARSAPRAPQSRLKSASERPWRQNKAHLASKSPPEASRRRFLELHGAIFHPPGNNCHTIRTEGTIFKNCPVCKAYASIRPASLDVLV